LPLNIYQLPHVTSQNTRIFSNTAVGISNSASKNVLQ